MLGEAVVAPPPFVPKLKPFQAHRVKEIELHRRRPGRGDGDVRPQGRTAAVAIPPSRHGQCHAPCRAMQGKPRQHCSARGRTPPSRARQDHVTPAARPRSMSRLPQGHRQGHAPCRAMPGKPRQHCPARGRTPPSRARQDHVTPAAKPRSMSRLPQGHRQGHAPCRAMPGKPRQHCPARGRTPPSRARQDHVTPAARPRTRPRSMPYDAGKALAALFGPRADTPEPSPARPCHARARPRSMSRLPQGHRQCHAPCRAMPGKPRQHCSARGRTSPSRAPSSPWKFAPLSGRLAP